MCDINYKPVCGTNGETYWNDCAREIEACDGFPIKRLYSGECRRKEIFQFSFCINDSNNFFFTYYVYVTC